MKVLGIDFSCALGALSNGQFPEKDCLLPLISKLLGYAIVAASTTVKLPQARSFSAVLFVCSLDIAIKSNRELFRFVIIVEIIVFPINHLQQISDMDTDRVNFVLKELYAFN